MRLFTVFADEEDDLITVNFSGDFIEFNNKNKLEVLDDAMLQINFIYETISEKVKVKNGNE